MIAFQSLLRPAFGRGLVIAGILSLGGPALAGSPWIEVRSEHFTVLTTAAERPAREWTLAMEQFVSSLRSALGDTGRRSPVTVLLFNKEREFRLYKPMENGKPQDVNGFFVRARDISIIAESLSARSTEARRLIQHETVHWYVSGRVGTLPLWLDEGLAETYSTFEMLDREHGVFGNPIDGYPETLRTRHVQPLSPIVNASRGSLIFNDFTGRHTTRLFYVESWALVHSLVFGDLSGGNRLDKYVQRALQGGPPDEAFRAEIGDYGEVEEGLRRYVAADSYRRVTVAVPSADIERSLRASPAKPAEVELALGSLLLAVGRIDAAEPHFRRSLALAAPPGAARAWEGLSQISLLRGDFPEAKVDLRKAVAAGSTSDWVAQEIAALARLR